MIARAPALSEAPVEGCQAATALDPKLTRFAPDEVHLMVEVSAAADIECQRLKKNRRCA
jgi:hypothetical protein